MPNASTNPSRFIESFLKHTTAIKIIRTKILKLWIIPDPLDELHPEPPDEPPPDAEVKEEGLHEHE